MPITRSASRSRSPSPRRRSAEIVILKRAFGRLSSIKGCEGALSELGFTAEVTFPAAQRGKNAADMMIAHFAARLAERRAVEAVVLVSSDGDFAPIAVGLAEVGVQTIGVGRSEASPVLQNACAKFISVTGRSVLAEALLHRDGAPVASSADLEKLKRIVDNALGKNGCASASTLGKLINNGFEGNYRKHFSVGGLTQLVSRHLQGYRIEGSGSDKQVARTDRRNARVPAPPAASK